MIKRIGFITVLLGAALFTLSAAWILMAPNSQLGATPESLGVTITDRNGITLRDTRASGGERWRWVALSDMDPVLPAAFIAAEDRKFLDHNGIAWRSTARALRDNLLAGRVVSGASTISMQLARMLRGQPRSFMGKLSQIAWAVRLELHWSKDKILEQYLNRVPLGQGTIGVDAAARLYFNTSSERLGISRSAALAGIARSPASNNPINSPDRSLKRRNSILLSMNRSGYISENELRLATNEPVVVQLETLRPSFKAPHFTSRVISEMSDAVSDMNSKSSQRVQTTIDYPLQERIEQNVRHTVNELSNQKVKHAAAVVIENSTGDILAWVGSPGFDAVDGQVDMVTSRRQPGSALKPFLYATAFEKGLRPNDILDDIPRTWNTSTGPYSPRNYDRKFRGPVRARTALGSSLNLPAVQLADRIGTQVLLDALHNSGFKSLDKSADYYGLGLSLGNGDISLLELANGYRVFANSGRYNSTRKFLDSPIEPSKQVFSPVVSTLILDILSDADARLAGFGDAPVFNFPFPVAVKTGTSRHYTDNWAVGVTAGFTVAVWVGNFDGKPMAAVSGITGAGPLLRSTILATSEIMNVGILPSPADYGATKQQICLISGMGAVDGCESMDEWVIPGMQEIPQDDWHRDGVVLLPLRFADWQRTNLQTLLSKATSLPSNDTEGLTIVSPKHGDVFEISSGPESEFATVALAATGSHSGAKLTWTVGNKEISGSRWKPLPGTWLVRVEDTKGNSAEARVTVRRKLAYMQHSIASGTEE